MKNDSDFRTRRVDDPTEIAHFDVHDFFVLSVRVLHRTDGTEENGYRFSSLSKSATIELGLDEQFPRYRLHCEDIAYLELCNYWSVDHILDLHVGRSHQVIDLIKDMALWERDFERRHGIQSTESSSPWEQYLCLIATSKQMPGAPECEPKEDCEVCPVSFPHQLTVVAERVWAEEISGHTLWP